MQEVYCVPSIESLRFTARNFEPLPRKFLTFQISWNPETHFVYPIPPRTVAKSNPQDIRKQMHSLYENEELCDVKLVAKDGDVPAHSLSLALFGGTIKTLLTTPLKKSDEEVDLKNYSKNTIKAFLDFIYLGEDGLKPSSISERNVDLVELFQLAHYFHVEPLIDHCTNLFSLFASEQNLDTIRNLAKTYDNEHLKELHVHLSLKQAPNAQKV